MSSMVMTPDQKSEILFAGFNQDFGCLSIGTDGGFRIYHVEPYGEVFKRIFPNGGIGIVEMLFSTNLLALVGGGRNPRFPPNKVMLWDDHQSRCIDLLLMDQMNTLPNPRGLVALCPDNSNIVLACPGINKGSVRVELYDCRKSTLIPAHESELAQIALNLDGTRLATASDKGTLLRVFDTFSGELLQELRRGMDRAEIYSIAFNPTSTFLACSSCKGTVHIFALVSDKQGRLGSIDGLKSVENRNADRGAPPGDARNATSGFSFMRSILPQVTPRYFASEWSYAQVRGLEAKTVIAFGQRKHTLICVGADGSYIVSDFTKGGEAERVTYKNLIKSADEEENPDPFRTPKTNIVMQEASPSYQQTLSSNNSNKPPTNQGGETEQPMAV